MPILVKLIAYVISCSFLSKLTDADAENTETEIWIKFSFDCKYINETQFLNLEKRSSEVGSMLGHIINNPEKYL